MIRKITVVLTICLSASLAACSSLDIVRKDSVRAFGDVLKESPPAEAPDGSWYIAAPDGEAEFYWSEDSVTMKAAAAPFVEAGLDISKLDNADERWIYYELEFEAASETGQNYIERFEYMTKTGRDALNYHTALDHYGVKLGDGNMFEWAKDLSKHSVTAENQDKDIVFVLNPEPLIAAGADPEKIKGWAYAEVSIEEDGKTALVWKLLKSVDLR
ncbi:MAG: hypothetical protein LBL35_04180 [Clostridiales bacterium]|jgi:hypothetical protein|nr:hypothetical protein [Clostridiales bacterium]